MRRGVKLPPNTKAVVRGSRWGNPYQVGESFTVPGLYMPDGSGEVRQKITRPLAVVMFQHYAALRLDSEPGWVDPLRGFDLACYCPLDGQPCHADVLLELVS